MPSWGGKVPDEQLWQLAAYVRSMSLPQTLAAQTDATPSQSPAPVPPEVDQDAGWSPPPTTTNDYTTTTTGPQ
jgi:cytochrome c oxidase cbb3-type subunit 3